MWIHSGRLRSRSHQNEKNIEKPYTFVQIIRILLFIGAETW